MWSCTATKESEWKYVQEISPFNDYSARGKRKLYIFYHPRVFSQYTSLYLLSIKLEFIII